MEGGPEARGFPVSLDRELVEEVQAAGLDPTEVAERALRRALAGVRARHPADPARVQAVRRELRAEIEWYNEYVEEHGLFSDEWRRF